MLKCEYETLLGTAKNNPDSIDFTQLRLAYTKSLKYNPYNTNGKGALQEALTEGNLERIITAGKSLLDFNYLNIDAHMAIAFAHLKLGEKTKEKYHRRFAHGLLESIFDSGDGKSPETAFVVIAVDEEYAVLNVSGLELTQQALITLEDEKFFDKMDCLSTETSSALTLYFDISLPYCWLRDIMSRKQDS